MIGYSVILAKSKGVYSMAKLNTLCELGLASEDDPLPDTLITQEGHERSRYSKEALSCNDKFHGSGMHMTPNWRTLSFANPLRNSLLDIGSTGKAQTHRLHDDTVSLFLGLAVVVLATSDRRAAQRRLFALRTLPLPAGVNLARMLVLLRLQLPRQLLAAGKQSASRISHRARQAGPRARTRLPPPASSRRPAPRAPRARSRPCARRSPRRRGSRAQSPRRRTPRRRRRRPRAAPTRRTARAGRPGPWRACRARRRRRRAQRGGAARRGARCGRARRARPARASRRA